MFEMIALDADDTLWHTEDQYIRSADGFGRVLSAYIDPEAARAQLHRTVISNVPVYGYGTKSYTLTMIESAIELSEGKVTASELRRLLDTGLSMMKADVHLLTHVADTLPVLAASHPLMLISKGDLFEQASKLARSGIADYFGHVEIVGEKTPKTYAELLKRYGVAPERFVMVGNSPKSDILPVLAVGGCAVYVPSRVLWTHEDEEIPGNVEGKFYQIEHLGQLPDLLARLEATGPG